MKRARIFLSALVLVFLSLATPAAAQQTIPRWDCCALIYSTGRWLGWSGALLDYTRERTAPSVYDNVILSNLRNAGLNCQSANNVCSSGVEAWPDWQAKQLWLESQIRLMQSDVYHKLKRNQVAGQINTAYGVWSGELARYRYRQNNFDQIVNRPTCAMYYFQIGFDTAYAVQAYRQAQEAVNGGNQQVALQQMAAAVNHLRRALTAFAGLAALERSPPPGIVCAPFVARTTYAQAIRIIVESGAVDLYMLARATEAAALTSDMIGNFLLQNCPRTTVTGGQQYPCRALLAQAQSIHTQGVQAFAVGNRVLAEQLFRQAQALADQGMSDPQCINERPALSGLRQTLQAALNQLALTAQPLQTTQPPRPPQTNAFCVQYANKALAQYQQSIQRGCGFGTDKRWQPNFAAHYNWCTQVSRSTANYEDHARDNQLATQCRPRPRYY